MAVNRYQLKILTRRLGSAVLGETLARSLHGRFCVRKFRRSGIVFVHIPRAGGTSISRAVLGGRAGHMTVAEIRETMGDREFDQLFSFSVTRNPYARLISAYRFARQGGGRDGAIRHHPAYHSEPFATFRRFVLEWLPKQNLQKVDPVFRPQWGYVSVNGKLAIDFLGKLEILNEVETVLSERLGRDIHVEHTNQSFGQVDGKKLYNKDSIEMVRRLYTDDFTFLGYDPNDLP